MFDHESKISFHVHENNHIMDFGSVKVVAHEANYHERFSGNCTQIFSRRALGVLLFESRVLTVVIFQLMKA